MRKWFLLFLAFCATAVGCRDEFSCEDCRGENLPPIADAGIDIYIALPLDSVQLDASLSNDPDGGIVSFAWTQLSGPANAALRTPLAERCTAADLQLGSYSFILEVTDNDGAADSDTVLVTIDSMAVPHPPVANAGEDLRLMLPIDSAWLDGSNSFDVDNNLMSYAWQRLSGPTVVLPTNPTSAKTLVKDLVAGEYAFVLTVQDSTRLIDKDTVSITVIPSSNKSPIAIAGQDITVSYNLATCSIEPANLPFDGSASYDPDGSIVSYEWKVISSRSNTAVFNPASASQTMLSQLQPETYQLALTVTDDEGATGSDTVTVNCVYGGRETVPAQLIPVGNLSERRKAVSLVVAGDKLFIAGGIPYSTDPGPHYSSRVDIYDLLTNQWSTAELSQARTDLVSLTQNNKLYFLAGKDVRPSTRMDILDLSTGFWSQAEIPSGGQFQGVAQGNNLFLAGGSAIQTYDISTGRWSTRSLSQPRYNLSVANVQGKIYFGGGSATPTGGNTFSTIDIYNGGSWGQGQLDLARYRIAGIGTRGRVFWAGGKQSDGSLTNQVEIVDVINGVTYYGCLFQPNAYDVQTVGRIGNVLSFFIGDGTARDQFDIYDVANNYWKIGKLPAAIIPSRLINYGNRVFVVGALASGDGYYDQVWELLY